LKSDNKFIDTLLQAKQQSGSHFKDYSSASQESFTLRMGDTITNIKNTFTTAGLLEIGMLQFCRSTNYMQVR